MKRQILLLPLILAVACDDPVDPSKEIDAADAQGRPPAGVTSLLYGSSSQSSVNPASTFIIDEATGAAALLGSSGVAEGNERISSIAFHPVTGRLYGIKGGACHGAYLIEIDPTTGAGTLVAPLQGGWFDGSPTSQCQAGADALTFTADGTMYVGGWNGGTPHGKLMRVDNRTGTVLEILPTPVGTGDWRGRRMHMSGLAFDGVGQLWASRGNSAVPPQLNVLSTVDASVSRTLTMVNPAMQPEDTIIISDLTFAPNGNLYVSLPWENALARIDTATGVVTRIGSFTGVVDRMSGITAPPRTLTSLLARYWFNEAAAGRVPVEVIDDTENPVNLGLVYNSEVVWTEDGPDHRGLESVADNGHQEGAIVAADGTKYDGLDGATEATFVYSARWVQPGFNGGMGGLATQEANQRLVAFFHVDAQGDPRIQFRTKNQTNVQVEWPGLNLDDDVRRVIHFVYDADDADPTRRIRMYVDGVDQGAGNFVSGAPPAVGEGLDVAINNLAVLMLNRWIRFFIFTFFLPPDGAVYYYAVHDVALTDLEIQGTATYLLGDDDNL